MHRRQFFGWLGKLSLMLGLGYLAVRSEAPVSAQTAPTGQKPRNRMMRMNGRACHDYRMVSGDRSMILDEEIFNI